MVVGGYSGGAAQIEQTASLNGLAGLTTHIRDNGAGGSGYFEKAENNYEGEYFGWGYLFVSGPIGRRWYFLQ